MSESEARARTTPWLISVSRAAFVAGFLAEARAAGVAQDSAARAITLLNANRAFADWWNAAAGFEEVEP